MTRTGRSGATGWRWWKTTTTPVRSSAGASIVPTAWIDRYAGIVDAPADMGSTTEVVVAELGPHVAALAGIVALAVLGGVLMIKNRLAEYNARNEDLSSSDEEFLSDRERVHHLVNANGGRMKQSEIVEAVDWSKAKVSRLLADLEEDGEITKLRLGRENLICLQGKEPTASKSSDGSGTE